MSKCYVNKVYVSGENLKDFEDFVSTESKEFSFNKVIPMPQTLNFNIGIMAGLATSFYIWRQTGEGNLYIKETPNLTKPQKQLLIGNNNKPLSFSKTIKWEKTKEEIAKAFPNSNIEWFYADEEIGTNCGELYAQDGIITEIDCDGDTEFAHTLWNIEAVAA